MKKLFLVLLPSLIIALDPINPNSSEQYIIDQNENAYPQDTAATEKDRALNSRIRNGLISSWLNVRYGDYITLNTINGVVTIRGNVPSREAKNAITSQVRGTFGVSRAIDDMQVAPP